VGKGDQQGIGRVRAVHLARNDRLTCARCDQKIMENAKDLSVKDVAVRSSRRNRVRY
jgi:hypothetical protein